MIWTWPSQTHSEGRPRLALTGQLAADQGAAWGWRRGRKELVKSRLQSVCLVFHRWENPMTLKPPYSPLTEENRGQNKASSGNRLTLLQTAAGLVQSLGQLRAREGR